MLKDRIEGTGEQGPHAALLAAIRSQFAIDWNGIHGIRHWERVRENGLRLAARNGANRTVVELFAYVHDSRRLDEWTDRGHGARAAAYLDELRGSHLSLTDEEFEALSHACRFHSDGLMEGDITVRTCWDADRLDLGRVGIRPRAEYLCTAEAAIRRSSLGRSGGAAHDFSTWQPPRPGSLHDTNI